MNIILCLDNRNGMTFNGRRQSRDRVVTEDMDRFLHGEEGEYHFLEQWDDRLEPEDIESVIVYRWNKKYPADHFCPIDFSEWEMMEETEFAGYSHEKITRQTYRRRKK